MRYGALNGLLPSREDLQKANDPGYLAGVLANEGIKAAAALAGIAVLILLFKRRKRK